MIIGTQIKQRYELQPGQCDVYTSLYSDGDRIELSSIFFKKVFDEQRNLTLRLGDITINCKFIYFADVKVPVRIGVCVHGEEDEARLKRLEEKAQSIKIIEVEQRFEETK